MDSLGYFKRTHVFLPDSSIAYYPGNRSVIVTEELRGADSLPENHLSIRFPRIFNAADLSKRARDLTSALTERGYPFASVSLEMKHLCNSGPCENDSLVVVFAFDKGEYCVNAQPSVHGLKYSTLRLIYNDITIRQGAPFDRRKTDESLRRLKSRSYISDVAIESPEILCDRAQSDSIVSVLTPFYVTDKSGIGFDGAAGLSKALGEKVEITGNLALSLLNVFHRGESAVLGYAGDSRLQRLDMTISKPWIFNIPVEIALEGGLEIVKQQYGFIHGGIEVLSEISTLWRTGFRLNAHETTTASDTIGTAGHFYGASLIITERIGDYARGMLGHQLRIDAGGGVSKKDKTYTRTQLSFEAGVHLPFFNNQAIVTNIFTHHIVSSEDLLLPAEMFRIGGNNTLRGYADNEYAFRTAVNGQLEYMMYFNESGAVYIFMDGAIGYKGRIGFDNRSTALMGYGIGLIVPSRIGKVSLEWARNIQDSRNPGRVHIRYENGIL